MQYYDKNKTHEADSSVEYRDSENSRRVEKAGESFDRKIEDIDKKIESKKDEFIKAQDKSDWQKVGDVGKEIDELEKERKDLVEQKAQQEEKLKKEIADAKEARDKSDHQKAQGNNKAEVDEYGVAKDSSQTQNNSGYSSGIKR